MKITKKTGKEMDEKLEAAIEVIAGARESWSALKILQLTEIPPRIRILGVLGADLVPSKILHVFASAVAERALKNALVTDEKIWDVILTKRRWVEEAVTDAELSEAYAAAASAWSVAGLNNVSAAVRDATQAARDAAAQDAQAAAYNASYSAARAASRAAAYDIRDSSYDAALDAVLNAFLDVEAFAADSDAARAALGAARVAARDARDASRGAARDKARDAAYEEQVQLLLVLLHE